ncbi:MAG: siroheme synthase CysG [Gammaproteobacteria bacterium]|nr:siroheme synthase CysG [Gammaproteobacteria bacterium]
MEFLPVFLDVKDRQCLLVGGGEVALRKARLLVRAGARLKVVAESIGDGLNQLLETGRHEARTGQFSVEDLADVVLVVAATDDEAVNRQVSSHANSLSIPVNVVDQPALCTMIFPAIVDRSPVVVAISSSGSSPVLIRQIKELLEVQLPGATGQLAQLLSEYRQTVKERIGSFDARIRFWESILDSDCPELVYSGQLEQARSRIESLLEGSSAEPPKGEVYLVGAGPGDPDLLTLKALRLMHKADVVLYDRLVSEAVLNKVRPDAERFYVGKERSTHQVPQDRINELLVEQALQGRRVLRLKGGDPFIFARGGEEMVSLIEHDIPFQVVPGITAALGCASYAGIPLTHRDHAHSVQFLTGHFKSREDEPEWQTLTGEGQTLVFYMGLMNLATICERLIEHGLSPDKPAALIQKGTTEDHQVVVADLTSLTGQVAQKGIRAPTLLIVGDVVKLREKLNWFEPDTAR